MTKQSQPRLVLAILSLAAFMASLDLFIVNVAFDNIGKDFHGSSLANLSWILNGYAIVFAALLVPLGRLADKFGRKRGFLAGVAVFTLASAACGASTSLWMLVVFRVIQAAGAAALTPTSLGLLLPVFEAAKRAGAVRIWASTGALAAAAGPAIGGVLVTASWRWVFLVNIPIGIVAFIAAWRVVPDAKEEAATRTPDLLGAGILTAAIGLFALGLVKLNDWSGLRTGVVLAVAVLGLAAFWMRSQRHHTPVVEPELLAVPAFAWANVTSLFFSIAFGANLLTIILWVEEVWHYSALRTGLAIVPGPLMVPIFSIVAGKLARKIPVGRVAAIGCVLLAVGVGYIVLRIGAHPDYAGALLPGWLIGGTGVGFALPTILSSGTADLPAHRFATGSAVVNMSRQIGFVLGVSILVAIIGTPGGYAATHHAFQHVWFTIAGVSLVAALAALGMTPRGARPAVSDPVLVRADSPDLAALGQ